eukprot:9615571-Alexandrium_andersonii.AAC.1
MSASLVGSEMCIRDRRRVRLRVRVRGSARVSVRARVRVRIRLRVRGSACLLYTSDAADDM